MIAMCLATWLAAVPVVSPAVETPADEEAVASRVRDGLAVLRAEAGAPTLGRRGDLDSAARARAATIAALPAERRLGRSEPMASLLKRHGIRRFERAEERVAILGGYEDPAAEALSQWAQASESRLLDRRWTAVGTGAATAPEGLLVIVALLFQEAAAPTDLRALERDVERAVNEVRRSHRLRPLDVSTSLRETARAHSEDMARRGYFAHVSPEGRGPVDRIARRGIAYRKVSENIAMSRGEADPARSAVDGWVASPGHRENLLDPAVRQTGVGVAADEEGALYFTQLFLDPARP